MTAGQTLDINVVPDESYDGATAVASGYEIDWANTELQNVTMVALDDVGDGTGNIYGYRFTLTGDGPYSVKLVTKKASTPEPELTPVTPDSAVVEVEAKTEADAIAKVQLSITDSAAKAAGQEDVVKLVATETSVGSGKWNVTVVIDEDAIVDPDVAVAEVAGALSGTGDSVSIAKEKLTPGLYYSLGTATAVDGTYTEGTRVLATGSAISFDLDKSGTAGFFKVFVNMTSNASAE